MRTSRCSRLSLLLPVVVLNTRSTDELRDERRYSLSFFCAGVFAVGSIPPLSAGSTPFPFLSAGMIPLPPLSARSTPLPFLSAGLGPLPPLSAGSTPLPFLSPVSAPLPFFFSGGGSTGFSFHAFSSSLAFAFASLNFLAASVAFLLLSRTVCSLSAASSISCTRLWFHARHSSESRVAGSGPARLAPEAPGKAGMGVEPSESSMSTSSEAGGRRLSLIDAGAARKRRVTHSQRSAETCPAWGESLGQASISPISRHRPRRTNEKRADLRS